MAVVASDRLTLATLPSPSYVRTFYLKQSSTLNPPGVPSTNPPGGNWSTTEPTFSPNETATVYTVMLTAYGTVSFEYGPVQKSSSFEAAKQAYNQAVASGKSASQAYNAAVKAQNDLANLQIGGRNLLPLDGISPSNVSDLDLSEYAKTGRVRVALGAATNGGLQLKFASTGLGFHEHFVLSYKYRKLSGSLVTFGGHTDAIWGTGNTEAWVDGESGGRYNGLSSVFVADDEEVHEVVVYGRTGNEESTGSNIWVQPNRGNDTPVEVEILDLKIERGNKVTDWSPAQEDVDASIVDTARAEVDALEIGGRNLIIRSTETRNRIIDATGGVSALNAHAVTDYIRVPDSEHLTLTKSYTPIEDNYFRLGWFDENRVFISRNTAGDGPTTLSLPEGAVYMLVSYPEDAQVKAERGKKSTDWSPAPEDVDAGIAGAIDELELGGRNYMLNSAQAVMPFRVATNNSATSPMEQGTDEIGHWVTGTSASSGEFYLSTYTNPTFESGRGVVFSEEFFPQPDVYTQSVEVMSEVGMSVRLGSTGDMTPIQPGKWTQVYRTMTPSDSSASRLRLWGPTVFATPDVPVGTKLYLRNWKLVKGAKATVWTPSPEDVDYKIVQSANGKNSITTSLNAPSGTGINGDLWRRHDSSGHVYQEFTWRDGSWKPTRVTSEMVTNMDIHKLTVSGDATFTTLVADEIWSEVVRAKLVVATELIAGDAIIKNTLSADRLKAKTITADSGVIDDLAIKEAHIGNSSVTNAKIKNLDAAKITTGYIDAARIDARTISTEKLLLGSFDNFFHDPRFEDERGYSPGVVVGETLRINAGHTVNVSWLAMPVDKDESYTVRFRKTGTGNLTFAIHSATAPSGPYSLVGESFNTATEAGDFEFTVTADKPYIRWVASNTTAQSFISDIRIRKVFTGIRLEDGVITTEKIQSGAVVADSIQTDAITSEHMGANSVTATSIGANTITGIHIGADTITGTHIEAESITALNIEAEAITADKIHAGAVTYDKIELGAVRGEHLRDITKDQFMDAIDDDLSGIIDSAETISDSVIITPGEIRLTTEVESSGTTTNETALSLTSTRQTFIVDGKDVVYIDSEEESMNIRNVVVDDSIQVGNHVIEKISDDITAFMWAGDR